VLTVGYEWRPQLAEVIGRARAALLLEGLLASASSDGTVRLWDAHTPALVSQLKIGIPVEAFASGPRGIAVAGHQSLLHLTVIDHTNRQQNNLAPPVARSFMPGASSCPRLATQDYFLSRSPRPSQCIVRGMPQSMTPGSDKSARQPNGCWFVQ
jgi:hypothetical protein